MTDTIKKYISQTNNYLKDDLFPAGLKFMRDTNDRIKCFFKKTGQIASDLFHRFSLMVQRANVNKSIDHYVQALSIINTDDDLDDDFQEHFHNKLLSFINTVKPLSSTFAKILYKKKSDKIFHQFPSKKFSSVRLNQQTLSSIETSQSVYYISNADFKTDIEKNPAGIAFQFFDNYIYVIFGNAENRHFMQFLNRIDLILRELKTKELYRTKLDTYEKKLSKVERDLIANQKALSENRKMLKKRVYGMRNLLEMSKELHYLQGVEKVISSSLLILLGQFRFQRSFALLYDSETMNYSRLFSKGLSLDKETELVIDVDSPMIKYLSDNIGLSEISEIYNKVRFKKILKIFQKWQIEFLIPILVDNRVKGVIGFGGKMIGGKLDKDEEDMIGILVDSVSISLGNAQLYEDVKKMSMTDAMTSLNNYRYFEDRLHEEINRARRKKSCVSLLMLDIDYFKNYNDSLGHQAGDEALRLIGSVLKITARDDDIVTRYGGEEFCVILPGVEKEVIRNLAERIRENVESFRFYKEDVQPDGKLTISLGGATFPDDADSFDDLVSKADAALYQSKHDGRNRFTLYSSIQEN
jgi:diguanylate cyclase (GGDEF)-like protein